MSSMFQHLVGAIGKSKMKLTWPLNSRRALPSRKKVHTCTHVQKTHTEYHTMPVKIQFWGSECTQKEDTGRKWPSTGQREAWNTSFPHSPQKESTLLTPWSWTCGLQDCEPTNFCCLSTSYVVLCYNSPSKLTQLCFNSQVWIITE